MAAIAAAHNQSENGPPTSSNWPINLFQYSIPRVRKSLFKLAAKQEASLMVLHGRRFEIATFYLGNRISDEVYGEG
jgi:hypothetical protein